jgi:hypothetical protein
MTLSGPFKFLDWSERLEVFPELPRIFGMVVSFPSYQVLFLTANSSFPKDPFDLVDRFLYF